MNVAVSRKTAPKALPVSLSQLKSNLNLSQSDTTHDAKLTEKIQAATEILEHDLDQHFLEQTLVLSYSRFPHRRDKTIQFSMRPVSAVVEVRYLDAEGSQQVFDASNYDYSPADRTLFLKHDKSWPATLQQHNAVEIEVTAGYGATPDMVPSVIKEAILLQSGAWWRDPTMENAENYAQDVAYERLVAKLMRETYP